MQEALVAFSGLLVQHALKDWDTMAFCELQAHGRLPYDV